MNVNDVRKEIERLILDRSDGEEGMSSKHIINGPHLVIVLLTCVFSPDSLISGNMVPITKGMGKPLS